MSRKVFISILGTGYYEETCYFHQNEEPDGNKVRFVQETSIKKLCNDWKETDCIYIFLTEKARETNWKHPAQKNAANDKQAYDGLVKRLALLNLNCAVKDVDILDGNNEQEIWEIFRSIYDALGEEDEVYFDITHAFRYLPMLLMVLINYTKFLKNIKVKQITYGNYEARQNGNSPILDITSFSQLQDWTSAAQEFLDVGNTKKVSILLDNKNISNKLNRFSQNIYTARGINIMYGDIATELKELLEKELINFPVAFNPILKIISGKLKLYRENAHIDNSLAAIQYCSDYNMIQQGITLLTELIISYVLIYVKFAWEKLLFRDVVSSALSINKFERFNMDRYKKSLNDKLIQKKITQDEYEGLIERTHVLVEKVFNLPFKKKLTDKVFKKLSLGVRHDINHAGIREEPKEAEYIEDRFNKYFKITKEIIANNPCS